MSALVYLYWLRAVVSKQYRGQVDLIADLEQRQIHFVSFTYDINTKTTAGLFSSTRWPAWKKECELIVERTRVCLNAPQKIGRVCGR